MRVALPPCSASSLKAGRSRTGLYASAAATRTRAGRSLLTVQGRATSGAQNILRTLSALAEDAITDEVADVNPFRGVRVRANDPRATKARRAPHVWTFDQMHAFAAKAGVYEPLVRVISDCGLRLGEVLALERRDFDGDTIQCEATPTRACSPRATSRPSDTSVGAVPAVDG